MRVDAQKLLEDMKALLGYGTSTSLSPEDCVAVARELAHVINDSGISGPAVGPKTRRGSDMEMALVALGFQEMIHQLTTPAAVDALLDKVQLAVERYEHRMEERDPQRFLRDRRDF